MARIDNDAVVLIDSLPAKHRKFLAEKFARKIPKKATRRVKAEIIAELVGTNHIHEYVNLYLSGNPRLFVWYVDEARTTKIQLPAVQNKLTRQYSNALSGIEPDLEPGGPPEFHRLRTYDTTTVLEFGMSDTHRPVMRNWKIREYPSDNVYRVALRAKPFTIEIRAFGVEKQHKLFEATETLLGADLSGMIRCDMSPKARYMALKKKLSARFCKVVHVANDMGISRSSLDADLITELDQTDDYKTQSKTLYRQEWSRSYEFITMHPDGYPERAMYTVNLESGDMRLSANISERAVEKLRQHVTQLF